MDMFSTMYMYYVELEVNDNDNFVLGNCCEFSSRSTCSRF